MASLDALFHPPTSTIPVHKASYPFISPVKHRGSLNGKIVLVTGAGRGIGRATALAFAAAGARVGCLSRTKSDLDSLVEEIYQMHDRRATALVGDVVDTVFAQRAVNQTEAALGGPIDYLINNAGKSRISDLEHEKDLKKAWEVIQIGMLGTMNFIQAVLPSMIARKSGTIINVVSILGQVSLPYFSAYSASKAGMIQYTKIMDMELRPKGIYSYAVHPCMSKDTTLAVGASNADAYDNVEALRDFVGEFMESNWDKVDLPADTFVALCVEEGAKKLSGGFVDATYDLEEVLRRAEADA